MIFQEVIIGMQLEAPAVLGLGQVAPEVPVLVEQADQIVDNETVVMVQRTQVLEVVLMDGLVEVQQDGDIIVTETLNVTAEGNQIQHGIGHGLDGSRRS